VAVTGSGSASKEQVAGILKHELRLTETPAFLDATDALGAAVCHFYQTRLAENGETTSVRKTNNGNWTNFVKNNPERVKK
jgi:crossover junction endodeoxyribonuclease RuvC